MKPQTGLSDKAREALGKLLNELLADAHLLYVKTRNYHWNVTGPHFNDLHKVFEGQYEALAGEIDEIAERGRALGLKAEATLADFLKRARLKERPGVQPEAQGMVRGLLEDHEAVIRSLRADLKIVVEKHGDAGTSDFLTGLMEQHEKMAWMLRAFLEG